MRTKIIVPVLFILLTAWVLVLRGAHANALLIASLLCAWLTILPGTLLVLRITSRTVTSLSTWVLGTAIGLNFLPIASICMFIVPTDIVWLFAATAISLWNIWALIDFKQPDRIRFAISESPLQTMLTVLILWLFYIYFYHFSYFYRTSERYVFDVFFGGDIPYLSAFVQVLEKSPRLFDPHFGGYIFQYHDFTFRYLAGLYHWSAGDIYDLTWYWGSTFSCALFFLIAYFIAYEFSEKRWSAFIMIFLLFFYSGKSSAIFSEDSDSWRFGLIQVFAILLLLTEDFKQRNLARSFTISIMLGSLAIWKLPAAIILLPSLLISELWKGKRYPLHRIRIITLATGAIIALGYGLILLRSQSNEVGGFVIGRPLGALLQQFESITRTQTGLLPSFSFSSIDWLHFQSFLLLILPYIAWVAIRSPRSFAVLFVPDEVNKKTQPIPFFRELSFVIIIFSTLFTLLFSPRYFYTSEVYYRFYTLALSGLFLASILPRLFEETRNNRQKHTFFTVGLLLSFILEVPLGLVNHAMLYIGPKQQLPSRLLSSLSLAKNSLPLAARVATQRFDFDNSKEVTHPNDAKQLGHMWNFEFYATGLERTVIAEGPSNGLLGGMAMNIINRELNIQAAPNARAWLDSTIRHLDTLYQSQDTTLIRRSQKALRVSHILIDHTINQQVSNATHLLADTVYSDSQITVLRYRD